MTSQRNLLLFALVLVTLLIWINWIQDKAAAKNAATKMDSVVAEAIANKQKTNPDEIITVKTDVLSFTINTRGGDIEQAQLLAYRQELDEPMPFTLLENTPAFLYTAQSGLIGKDGIDSSAGRALLETSKKEYFLAEGENELRIPLTYRAPNGAVFTKIFTAKRGQYDVDVSYAINNTTTSPLEVMMYGQLKQTMELPKTRDKRSANFALNAYRGTAYSSDEKDYKKYSFSDVRSENLNLDSKTGWIAMLQHYFVSAWIPQSGERTNTFYTNKTASDEAIIGFKTTPIIVAANQQTSVNAKLWMGPEVQDKMEAAAKNLNLTVDYGWFSFISQPLFKLLKIIQSFVGNWGIAIILITFVVRGIMYPLTRAQYTSMARMKLLQPRIEAMRERYGEDKQRLSQEMMALYKKEKVNPLGGCLPILIQMPIFLALFYMLSGSIELRHAPFMLWIRDLSAQDPYYILPLLMGGTMFLIQKMSPTPVADPMQQKIMTFMPVMFTVFFLWFPSGLVLYYTVSNLVTIAQQKLIYRGLEKRGLHVREKKNKK